MSEITPQSIDFTYNKKMLLREQEIYPSKEILQETLGKAYHLLEELETQLTQAEFSLSFNWNYYKDSKAWLCKVSYKKKTIFRLSIWEGYFRASFFFLERHLEGIRALGIDEKSFSWLNSKITKLFASNDVYKLKELDEFNNEDKIKLSNILKNANYYLSLSEFWETLFTNKR